jgi:hypothetical protein
MDGQVWLFINRLSETSDLQEAMRNSRKPSRPCLEWPDHGPLVEAQRLRSRTLWRWAAEAMSRLLRRTPPRVREAGERSGEHGAT